MWMSQLQIFILIVILQLFQITNCSPSNFTTVNAENPVHLVIPLPEVDDFNNGKNPFLLSLPKVKPLIDLALERVYENGLIPRNAIDVIYRNSNLSDALGPNVAVQQLLIGKIDCIIGYAYGYALAPVARMSPYWGNGIPVITPIGLTMSLDDKSEYQLMTRINSPYKVVSKAVKSLFKKQNWKRHLFMFHHAKSPTVAVGECFLLMASIQHPLRENFEMQHNFFTFNEENHEKMSAWDRRKEFREYLMQSSFVANGTSFHFKQLLKMKKNCINNCKKKFQNDFKTKNGKQNVYLFFYFELQLVY